MKPSRELDAQVAIGVMGQAKRDAYYMVGDPPDSYEKWIRNTVSHYSTDVAAAFAVDKPSWLWEFQEAPGTLTVTLYTSFMLRRKAIEMYPILPEGVILIRREWLDDKAQTYAWLRCLAALEAVSVICVPEGESITLGNNAVLKNVTVVGVETEDA